MRKKQVFFCDDEEKYRDAFEDKHSKSFDLKVIPKIYSVTDELKKAKKLPDLVVLDLYHTKASQGTPDATNVNETVKNKVGEVDRAVDSLRKYVNQHKDPAAMKILNQIRSDPNPKIKALPVILYSRQGLAILDNETLTESARLGADWMLKREEERKKDDEEWQTKDYEEWQMNRIIDDHRPKEELKALIKTKRKWAILALTTLCFVIFLTSVALLRKEATPLLIEAVGGIIVVIYFVTLISMKELPKWAVSKLIGLFKAMFSKQEGKKS